MLTQPSNVHKDHVPEPHATANYMQLTTMKRAEGGKNATP